MKVRLLENTIRFRLKQSEVRHFGSDGEIKQITIFGPLAEDQLTFALRTSHSNDFHLSFNCKEVVLQVPASVVNEWMNSDMVGIEQSIDTGKGQVINVLVEKDFKCLEHSKNDDDDAFPNPNLQC